MNVSLPRSRNIKVNVEEVERKRERVEDELSRKHTDYIGLWRLRGDQN